MFEFTLYEFAGTDAVWLLLEEHVSENPYSNPWRVGIEVEGVPAESRRQKCKQTGYRHGNNELPIKLYNIF